MELRPYQKEAVSKVEEEWQEGRNKTLLVLPTGCHAIGERLLMSDGKTKAVEEIRVGECLVGPDGTNRIILAKTNGFGKLYRIVPIKGEPFIVSGNHKLTLKRTKECNNPKFPSEKRGGEIVDVTVEEWCSWSNWKKHLHKLVRSNGVEHFDVARNDIPIEPYFLGLLLGDGSFCGSSLSITTMESEVVDEIHRQCEIFDLEYRIEPAGKATTFIFSGKQKWENALSKCIREIGLAGKHSDAKFVPDIYKFSNAKQRLEMIAGLLDSDGSMTCNGYDFISKSKQLSDDLTFMCRSVGLAAYMKECQKSCGDFTGTYYRVSISGNCNKIPNRVMRKKCEERKQKKDVLVTGFSVEPVGKGDYIGFTVDVDNRYLLDDFTITHNCGKTIVFSQIAKDCVNQGERVLILAHRGELLEQASDKIYHTTGLQTALEKAEHSCLEEPFKRVVVGSVQTLMRDARLDRFDKDYFDTIIIDEAHHAVSQSYWNILNHFYDSKVLGVTATADRADMKDLGEVFDSLAYEYSLPQAIKDGYLCRIKAQTIPMNIDLSSVRVHGDFQADDVASALDPYLGDIAAEMAHYCKGRRTVVFLPLIATSQKFCRYLKAQGFRAAEVNGESADRADVLRDFKNGKYDVLCNSMLLTEGWDCPPVDCIVVLRPTKSRALYSQMVGRGTRLYPGKKELLLLDFLWMCEKHELCRPAHLLAKDKAMAKAMTKRIEEAGGMMDLEAAEQMAEKDVIQEREEALAKELDAMKRRKRKLVDPLQFEMSIQAEDLANYTPSFGWELMPVSETQKKFLESRGIYADNIESAGKASQLIDRLKKRQQLGLATPKQIRFLEGKGFRHVGTWAFEAAKKMIARISFNGWRVPNTVDPWTYEPKEA